MVSSKWSISMGVKVGNMSFKWSSGCLSSSSAWSFIVSSVVKMFRDPPIFPCYFRLAVVLSMCSCE